MKFCSAFALVSALVLTSGAPAVARNAPFAAQLIQAHNVERAAVGAAPLRWDAGLAAAADGYAAELARTGNWGHSPAHQRVGQGENLWMGTRGAFTLATMMNDWAGEKRMFRAGVFPNVVVRGNWADVGHYTQIIWPSTSKVGCSLRSSAEWDYLVCRYSTPGNAMGERVGRTSFARR